MDAQFGGGMAQDVIEQSPECFDIADAMALDDIS